MSDSQKDASIFFYDRSGEVTDTKEELLAGLLDSPKSIAPKFFYNDRGSELFDEITRLPEYYLTRTEIELLNRHVDDIANLIGPDCVLIEYGSGSSEKIRLLLDSLLPEVYVPLDISRARLSSAASALASEYPWLEIRAACLDYTNDFELPFPMEGKHKIAFFPGSSIGNFDHQDALEFLQRVRRLVGVEGGLLIGVDLKKEQEILNAAYNDSQGITAAFNKNMLNHVNDLIGANFVVDHFEHMARYNARKGCMEMFLVSALDQLIKVGDRTISLRDGEKIHTENSYKYTAQEFTQLAGRAGFSRHVLWTDDNDWFGVFFLSA